MSPLIVRLPYSIDHWRMTVLPSALTATATYQAASVTVTFNPDIALLRRQLAALSVGSLKVLVDNASSGPILQEIRELIDETPNAVLLINDKNIGLASAINRGARAIKDSNEVRFILLLDQDTEPHPDGVTALVEAFGRLESAGQTVGMVGPKLVDPVTGLQHGFHRATKWRWIRIFPPCNSIEPVPCSSINGSGTLMPLDLFLNFGGLDEDFFIDHVDTEWSFRVLAGGFTLWGIPSAEFAHHMGERTVRFWWFGWRIWPMRSPQRHYYLFRNAVRLFKRRTTPKVWTVWNVGKLALTVAVHLIIDPDRRQQLKYMLRGVIAGIRSSR